MYGFYLCLRKAQLIFLAAGARFTDVEFCLETLYVVHYDCSRILLLSVPNRHISNWGSYPCCYQIPKKENNPNYRCEKRFLGNQVLAVCKIPIVCFFSLATLWTQIPSHLNWKSDFVQIFYPFPAESIYVTKTSQKL